jgi:hypothetical protein
MAQPSQHETSTARAMLLTAEAACCAPCHRLATMQPCMLRAVHAAGSSNSGTAISAQKVAPPASRQSSMHLAFYSTALPTSVWHAPQRTLQRGQHHAVLTTRWHRHGTSKAPAHAAARQAPRASSARRCHYRMSSRSNPAPWDLQALLQSAQRLQQWC